MSNAKIMIMLLSILCISCKQQKTGHGPDDVQGVIPAKETWTISTRSDWLKNMALMNVECIKHDKAQKVFYATNGVDYRPGTDGFISKISGDGALEELKWVDSLNRPTGMAIHDSLLYVADVNALLIINTNSRKIINRLEEPIHNVGLNDVAISQTGEVYVSGSFVHSIFKVSDGQLETWVTDEEKLKWANGIMIENDDLLVAGLHLNKISTISREITPVEMGGEIEDFDGIIADGSGGYFVTTVESRGLYHLSDQWEVTQLMDGGAYFGDLEFDVGRQSIYLPRGNTDTGDFFITVLEMEK